MLKGETIALAKLVPVMNQPFQESKRINAFRRNIIAAVPRFPNDKASLKAVEAKHLTDLLIMYIAWRLRFVGDRPRKILGLANIAGDPRTSSLQSNIDAFLRAVENGTDLTPYLSLDVHRGYTPAAEKKGQGVDRWEDKDLLLNVMGLHHFHLGLTMEAAGHALRTDVVLFASVTRDEFEIVGLFDHAAFEHDEHGAMTPEREKIWRAYEALEAARHLPGQLSVGGFGGGGVTLSSHPVQVVRTAQRHMQIIQEIDPQLDNPVYLSTFYPGGEVPNKPKLVWTYRDLDLCLYDPNTGFLGVLSYGPN